MNKNTKSELDNNLISIGSFNEMYRSASSRNIELLSYQNRLFIERLTDISNKASNNGKDISGVIDFNGRKMKFENKADLVTKIYILTIADMAGNPSNLVEYLIAYKHIGSLFSYSYRLKSEIVKFSNPITQNPFSHDGILADFYSGTVDSVRNKFSLSSFLWDPNNRHFAENSWVSNNEIILNKLKFGGAHGEFIFAKPIVDNGLPKNIREGLLLIINSFYSSPHLHIKYRINEKNVKFFLSKLNEDIFKFLKNFLQNPSNSHLVDEILLNSDELSTHVTRSKFLDYIYRTNKLILDFNTLPSKITTIDFRSIYLAIKVFIETTIL